jgi:type IV secretion system protein VirB1
MDNPMIAAAVLACAANIAPVTLAAVINIESRGDPLAIFDNTARRAWHPRNQNQAIALARDLIVAGHVIDAGLMQVDSLNFSALGLDASRIFDPCTNVRAGGAILTADYAAAAQRLGQGQEALKVALSLYNTGSFMRGFRNGYIARYYGPGGMPVATEAVCHVAPARLHVLAPAKAGEREATDPWPGFIHIDGGPVHNWTVNGRGFGHLLLGASSPWFHEAVSILPTGEMIAGCSGRPITVADRLALHRLLERAVGLSSGH